MNFRRIFSEVTIDAFDYSGYYSVLLTEHSDDCEETIRKILEDFWSLHMANTIILIPSENYELILMYTFFPFTPEHCERVKPIVYNYFENGTFVLNLPVFPEKFNNLYRCSLKIATYHYPPFIMLTHRSNDTYIDGIEGVVLRVISQKLNFTTIVIPSSLNILNKISNTSNASEIKRPYKRSLELISDGTANVTLGSIIVAATRAEKYEMTKAYFYGSLLYAIPMAKPYSSLEKLFFPFRYKIWILLCGIFFTAAIVLLLLKLKAEKNRTFLIGASNNMPFFNMLNVCLGGTVSLNDVPIRNFARAMLMIWLVSTLVN